MINSSTTNITRTNPVNKTGRCQDLYSPHDVKLPDNADIQSPTLDILNTAATLGKNKSVEEDVLTDAHESAAGEDIVPQQAIGSPF